MNTTTEKGYAKWYEQQERVQRTWERCYECASVIYSHETHLQINDKNITDHLHAKESPVARSNMWPNGHADTDTRPSYSILRSTRLSKQDDTRALSHNTQLSIWRQGRLAGDLGLTKQTERSLVSYLRRFTPPNPVKDICH